MTMNDLLALLRLTLTNPRAAARALIALDLPLATGWTALLFVALLSAALGYLGFLLFPTPEDPLLGVLFSSPFGTALIQIAVHSTTAAVAWGVGRMFGGVGSLANALTLVAWVQIPLVGLQVVQLVIMGTVPGLAPLLGIFGLALYVVLLSLFVAELHGFRSGLLVFLGMIATSFALAVPAATIIAAAFGVSYD